MFVRNFFLVDEKSVSYTIALFTSFFGEGIVRYGQIHFKTEQGLNEVYMVSNADALEEFASIFDDYKEVLTSS